MDYFPPGQVSMPIPHDQKRVQVILVVSALPMVPVTAVAVSNDKEHPDPGCAVQALVEFMHYREYINDFCGAIGW